MRTAISVSILLFAVALPHPAQAQWRTGKEVDPLDDSMRIVAGLDAVEGVDSITQRPILLAAECSRDPAYKTAVVYRAAVIIGWKEYLSSNPLRHSVTYRFPPAPPRTSDWTLLAGRATALRKERAITFLRDLVQNKRLIVRPEGTSTTAIFDLTGAWDAIKPIAEQCSFRLPRRPSSDK